jgi:hypothetical protein
MVAPGAEVRHEATTNSRPVLALLCVCSAIPSIVLCFVAKVLLNYKVTYNALPGADGLSLPPLPAVLTEKRGIFLSAAAALCRDDDN